MAFLETIPHTMGYYVAAGRQKSRQAGPQQDVFAYRLEEHSSSEVVGEGAGGAETYD